MSIRILIADDNAFVRAAMRQVLECVGDGWQIIEAENGQEAVAKAHEFEPSLVILDLVMPQKNGLSAAREIRVFLPDVPILMHTLYSSRQVELEAGKAGVRKIVPKSDSRVLVAAVEDLLRSQPPQTSVVAEPVAHNALAPISRTEDKIRELCTQLFATKDDQENAQILVRLRDALHRHIEHLRARVAEYPVVLRRRVQNRILPHDTLAPENPAKDLASPNRMDARTNAAPELPSPGSTIKTSPQADQRSIPSNQTS